MGSFVKSANKATGGLASKIQPILTPGLKFREDGTVQSLSGATIREDGKFRTSSGSIGTLKPEPRKAPVITYNNGTPFSAQQMEDQSAMKQMQSESGMAAPGEQPISAVQKLQDRYQNLIALKAYRGGRQS